MRESADGDLTAVAFGVITTPARTPMPDRLHQLHTEITALIARYQPDAAAIETLYFGRMSLRHHRRPGARRDPAGAGPGGLPVREYKPAEINRPSAGYGNADKWQMQEMIRQLLRLDDLPRPDDAADGLGVAITVSTPAASSACPPDDSPSPSRESTTMIDTVTGQVAAITKQYVVIGRAWGCACTFPTPCATSWTALGTRSRCTPTCTCVRTA